MRKATVLSLLSAFCLLAGIVQAKDGYEEARKNLLAEIQAELPHVGSGLERSTLDPRVAQSLLNTPRHEFVAPGQRSVAYQNRPLPIGHGQTISQPFIVAIMTDLLRLEPGARVLEIGTGSGYQAAVLAPLAREVYTIEIIPELAAQAAARLRRLGYTNIQSRVGDGYYGWPERAPFDAIIVTAAPTQIPPPLVQQLAPGGRMVIPVGSRFHTQSLLLVEKDPDGTIHSRQLLPVQFVPLTGGH